MSTEQWHPKAGSKVPHRAIIAQAAICTNSWPFISFYFDTSRFDVETRLDLINVEIEIVGGGLWRRKRGRIDAGSHPLSLLNLNYSPQPSQRQERAKENLLTGVDFSSWTLFGNIL